MNGYGIMFHHFASVGRPCGQGTISANELSDIIEYVGRSNKIISAPEWIERLKHGALERNDVCLTFDDGLRCQFEVALPVLDSYGLNGFWFVYTAPFQGGIQRLELYRYYRNAYFEHINEFYAEFKRKLNASAFADKTAGALQDFRAERYLNDSPFYSDEDKKFRFLRDQVLGHKAYFQVMDEMIDSAGIDAEELTPRLFLSSSMLKKLNNNGHIVGLHSHTHPTTMNKLSLNEQRNEYDQNREYLEGITGAVPISMSHPCNSYNSDTIDLLEDMSVVVGFRANMTRIENPTEYEYPREDHTNIINEIRS